MKKSLKLFNFYIVKTEHSVKTDGDSELVKYVFWILNAAAQKDRYINVSKDRHGLGDLTNITRNLYQHVNAWYLAIGTTIFPSENTHHESSKMESLLGQ